MTKSNHAEGIDGSAEVGFPVNVRRRPRHRGSGFVMVRLDIKPERADYDSLEQAAERLDLARLTAVLDRYGLGPCYPAFRGNEAAIIGRLEQEVESSALKPLRSLRSYWRIDARHVGDIDSLIADLNRLREVAIAYPEHAVTTPTVPVTPEDDEFSDQQGYLDPAPDGIDARWTWTQKNCQGEGVALYDLEGAWNQHHPDLKNGLPITEPIHGINGRNIMVSDDQGITRALDSGNHGTAVLGITVARDNRRGIVGIAPAVSDVKLVSYYQQDGGQSVSNSTHTVASAILAAVDAMRAGDVLLLEVQLVPELLPIEAEDALFDAIRLAVAHGIVVIEAAGNGSKNLDEYLNEAQVAVFGSAVFVPFSLSILDATVGPFAGHFRDSGAIMVGAARSDSPHPRWDEIPGELGSNYGARVDCYAWGENVMTLGYGDVSSQNCSPPSGDPDLGQGPDLDHGTVVVASAIEDDNGGGGGGGTGGGLECYTHLFGGTSAASAIIAGAALVLQGKYQATTGSRLSPGQMRRLLSDADSGTEQGSDIAGNIGVMPDLKAIIGSKLCLVPDVYIRDHTADTGVVKPGNTITGQSPDIVVSTQAVPAGDPFSSAGDPENPLTILPFGEQFVFVRIRNRGNGVAASTTVSIYEAPAASYAAPSNWRFLGSTSPVDVPGQNQPVVTGPVAFQVRPQIVRGKLIAVVDQADDPPPPLPNDPASANPLVLNHNNIASREFFQSGTVVANNGVIALGEFALAGTGQDQVHELQIESRLPPGARLLLEIGAELGESLDGVSGWQVVGRDEAAGRLRIALPPLLPCFPLVVALEANAEHTAQFLIESDDDRSVEDYRVVVRQLLQGQEIGRITMAAPPRSH